MPDRRSTESGFTYIGLLMAIAIMGLMLTVAGRIWSTTEQRERETQLLWAGHAYRNAIAAYLMQNGHYPMDLKDLLGGEDSTVPHRYLRQLYPDPMTGLPDWSLILAPNGSGIMGIASTSEGKPFKTKNFDSSDASFEDAVRYADWQFIYVFRRWRPTGVTGTAPDLPPVPAAPQPGRDFQPGHIAPGSSGGPIGAPRSPAPSGNTSP